MIDYATLLNIINRDSFNAWELVGFILPPFIDILNRYIENSKIRFLVSLLFCAIVGVLINFKTLKYESSASLLASMAVVFSTAKIAYTMFYKDSLLQNKIVPAPILKG